MRVVRSSELRSADTVVPVNRRAAVTDLAIAIAFFAVCYAVELALDPLLRHGRGLVMVFALATYQFMFEGLALLLIMRIRHEHFSDYGFTRRNAGKSVALALVLAGIYDLAMSWHANALLWIPMRRQPAVRMSVEVGLPLSLVGLAVTVAAWGFFEGFFGVFFAKKLNQAFGHHGPGCLSPGTVGFALFNGLIHLTVHQGISGFIGSFASGYAIAVIPGGYRKCLGKRTRSNPHRRSRKALSKAGAGSLVMQTEDRRGFRNRLANAGRAGLVSAAGIEPATHALKGRCSTN